MLDSSPVALPPVPRPLKRSSSTASLPTPPRTQRKRRPTRSKASSDESDEDNTADSGDQVVWLNKKRRISAIQEEEEEDFDDEDIFWAGGKNSKATGSASKSESESATRRSESPVGSPVPLLFRNKRERAQSTSSLVSPPPSFRKAKPAPLRAPVVRSASPTITSPPRTPKNKVQRPVRDSPNNPFLDPPGGVDDASDNEDNGASLDERPYEEKPTVTFVYRGVRKTFANPYYDPVKKGPVSPTPNSLLPPEHIDFSPDLRCPPKILFPKKKHREGTKVDKGKASTLLSDVFADDSENEASLEVQPTKLFADELKATERSKR